MASKRPLKPRTFLGEMIVSWERNSRGKKFTMQTVVGSSLQVQPGRWVVKGFGKFNYSEKVLGIANRVVIYHKIITVWIKFEDGGDHYDFVLGRIPENGTDDCLAWVRAVEQLNIGSQAGSPQVSNKSKKSRKR